MTHNHKIMEQGNNNFTPQKSAAWFDERCGIITNSNFHKLMAGADKITATSELSKGAKTYIETIFWELAEGHIKEVKAWTLEYGNTHEPIAKQKLANSIKQRLADCEFVMHPELCYYGGSPELDPVSINGILTTTEIKSPATGVSHNENIEMCKAYKADSGILQKAYPELCYQINGNMLLQNTQMCVFVSYHETKLCTTDYLEYYFPRDERIIDLMMLQLPKAYKYYCEYGEKHGVNVHEYLTAKHEAYFERKLNAVADEINNGVNFGLSDTHFNKPSDIAA